MNKLPQWFLDAFAAIANIMMLLGALVMFSGMYYGGLDVFAKGLAVLGVGAYGQYLVRYTRKREDDPFLF
jgi:uncharacterized membrane protein YiaA